jgi:hypothetical protein
MAVAVRKFSSFYLAVRPGMLDQIDAGITGF